MINMSTAMNASHALNYASHGLTSPAVTQTRVSVYMHSEDLLRGQKAVEIVHNGSTYRLQATRLGKLILTK